jgi:hypothetical protein
MSGTEGVSAERAPFADCLAPSACIRLGECRALTRCKVRWEADYCGAEYGEVRDGECECPALHLTDGA